jgi:hypothetical protein
MIKSCDCRLSISFARYGCAQGKHRAYIVGSLIEDWISRSVCAAWHIGLGRLEDTKEACECHLKAGIDWLEKQESASPNSESAQVRLGSRTGNLQGNSCTFLV